MAEIKTLYGTATTLPVTGLATLASGANATSDSVSNITEKNLDALISVNVVTGGAAATAGVIEIYVKASINNTDFDDDFNDKWIGTVIVGGSGGTTTRMRAISVASGFQGTMPPYWKIRVKNSTGAAFASASITYVGVSGQSV